MKKIIITILAMMLSFNVANAKIILKAAHTANPQLVNDILKDKLNN